jgi:hypothetical protein
VKGKPSEADLEKSFNPACGGTGRIPLRGTKPLFFVKNEGLRRGSSVHTSIIFFILGLGVPSEYIGVRRYSAQVNQFDLPGSMIKCTT